MATYTFGSTQRTYHDDRATAAVEENVARRRHLTTTTSHSGSIYGVDVRFQSFGINDLEMVAQTTASWNQIAGWLRQLDLVPSAA